MLRWLKHIGSSSVYLLHLSSSSVYHISQTEMGCSPQKWRPNLEQDLMVVVDCLDAIRPPILLSAYTLPSLFGEIPNPISDTLQQTGTSGKSLRLKPRKEGNCSLRECFFRHNVIHALGFISLSFYYILSIKIFFFQEKNKSWEGINNRGGIWNAV